MSTVLPLFPEGSDDVHGSQYPRQEQQATDNYAEKVAHFPHAVKGITKCQPLTNSRRQTTKVRMR